MAEGSVPQLPGNGLAYAPGTAQMLLNSKPLDAFAAQYGLAGP